MSDGERSLYDELLDVVVYAPIGAALKLAELVPDLVSKGRQRVGAPIATSNAIGHMAIGTARRVVTGYVSHGAGARSQPDDRGETDVEFPPDAAGHVGHTQAVSGQAVHEALGDLDEVHADELAIIGYDTLAASQIVDGLTGLSADDLELIRRYEWAHRGRRTILSRIAQLHEV